MLILMLVVLASLVAIVPAIIARGQRVHVMRQELLGVLAECRLKYDAAPNAADSAGADEWVPRDSAGGAGNPPCGKYRRRNMLGREE